MKLKNLLLICSLGLFAFGACKKSDDSTPANPDNNTTPVTPTPYVPDNSFKIVAYMPSYKDPETVDMSKYKMITHLFYAFLELDAVADGTLKPLSQPTRFETVMQRARANNVKVGISVSGSSANFATMASTSVARTKFVTNVVNFAKNNNLNGVDIDWEYPSTSGTAPSADNFVLLMKELSAELHKLNKFLSAAVTPAVYSGGIRDGIKPEVFQYVDFLNIMQYDGIGYDTSDPYQHASYKMSVASLDQYLNVKGLDRLKAVVGIPTYGKNAQNAAKGYRDIEATGADVNANMGTGAGVDYYFNGINLVKQKAQLAKDRANGIMFWEFSFDTNNANSLIKAANDQLGRSY